MGCDLPVPYAVHDRSYSTPIVADISHLSPIVCLQLLGGHMRLQSAEPFIVILPELGNEPLDIHRTLRQWRVVDVMVAIPARHYTPLAVLRVN